METAYCCFVVLVLLFAFVCVSNSDVLSGLSRFGLTRLDHEVCNSSVSADGRTCYHSVVTHVSCFTVHLQTNSCKTHIDDYVSNDTSNKPSNWTHLQAYYHRFQGGRRRHGDIGTCVEMTQDTCPQYQCKKTCCLGWEMGSDGQCSKRASSLCKNGGTYDHRRHRCMCRHGFSGNDCEIAKCHGGCLHGGECLPSPSGMNACRCPTHTSGGRCQHLQCPKCENGGKCIADGPLPACKCPSGFYGKTCAHSYWGDSECPPPNNTICTDLDYRDDCTTDSNCPSGQVCCTDGCCMKCVESTSSGCWYNGVLFELLTSFRKDNCTECVCRLNGSATCMTVPVDWGDADCCFFDCQGTTTVTPKQQQSRITHKPPTINCSSNMLTVPVSSDSDRADMVHLNIRAMDENGTELKVRYSPTTLVHNRTPYWFRVPATVTVSATDQLGHRSSCFQKVAVVDHASPKFDSCPSDFTATNNHIVTWVEPKASDNVGVRSLPSNYKTPRYFATGLFLVVYTAVDYDENKAFCHFNINVTDSRIDKTPPMFLSCPSGAWGTEGRPIYWTEPRAYDNVGIRSLVSNVNSGSVFPPGITEVKYTATDYSYNTAHCRFSVRVAPKDSSVPDSPQASESHMTDAVKIIVGTISSLIVVLVIITLSVIICRRYRLNLANRAGPNGQRQCTDQTPIPAISNSMYDGMGEHYNDAFVPTLKPPPYSPATAPPAYEEVYTTPDTDTLNGSLPAPPPDYDSLECRT